MCANPKLSVASESCCFVLPEYPTFGSSLCEYKGEVVTFNRASQRCESLVGSLCDPYCFPSYLRYEQNFEDCNNFRYSY